MPSKLTVDKAKAIARSYCSNGHDKGKALLDNGYSESYAKSGAREETYNTLQVKQAIADIEAELSAECTWTAKESEKTLKEAITLAKQQRQPTAITGAVAALNKMLGLDKEQGAQDPVKIVIEQPVAYPKLTKEA